MQKQNCPPNKYELFHKALGDLYEEVPVTLLLKDKGISFSIDVWDNVVKWLHEKGDFTPEMLTEEPAKELIGETYRILSDGTHSAITEEVPPELVAQLDQNTYVFSGFKTYHELKEASNALVDKDGKIKSFESFKQDAIKINNTYNQRYLETEYNFAMQSAQMAVKWADMEADGDRYYLQYRTANDSKVRAEHAELHGVTLPTDDPFWDNYFPPLGWNCRCTVMQVNKDKYQKSNSAEAIKAGERATNTPKKQIFRFNPGKQGKIFPPKHPYLPKGCKGCNKNKLNLAYNPNSEDCRACLGVAQCEHTICNKREYERLKKDPDYIDVEFDPKNGGVKGTHKDHNFDKKGGLYEKHVQNAGYKAGYSVIFGPENHSTYGVRHTEGLWNGNRFEVAGRETGTLNNVFRGLKHCAAKRNTQIAVLDFPNGGYNKDILMKAIAKYRGLEKLNDSQFVHFEKIICVENEEIVYEEDF